MIVFFLAGLVATVGTIKMFNLFLENKKEETSYGMHVLLFLYMAAVFLPFIYIAAVVAFGLGVLFLFSLEFEAKPRTRIYASLAAFSVLMGTRIGVWFLFGPDGELVVYVLASLIVFLAAALLQDIKKFKKRRTEKETAATAKKEMEDELNLLVSQNLMEQISQKAKTAAQLQNALELLDRYKLEELELLLKKMLHK